MSSKYIILHGLPGSGKSTITDQYIKEHPSETVVINNRDSIRSKLFGEDYHKRNPDKKSEQQVTIVQNKIVEDALSKGYTVIDDNTNLNPRFLRSTVQQAQRFGAEIQQISVDVPIEECKRRNRKRASEGGRFVPEAVIDSMASHAYDEDGKMKDFIISKNGSVSVIPKTTTGMKTLEKYNEKLEKNNPFNGKAVVLVDCDGTLINNAHQAAFYLNNPNRKKKDFNGFYKSVETAPVNEEVRDLANSMRDNDGVNIMLLTGRDDSHVNSLISFLDRSGVNASRLVMKRAGDMRPDGEFKKEAIDNLKKEGLIPVAAIDDRDSSIKTMEELGIRVSKVDNPSVVISPEATEPPAPTAPPRVNTVYGTGTCMRCGSKLKEGNLGKRCATKMNI